MFPAMIMDAFRDERPGIRIPYRTANSSTSSGYTSSRVYPQLSSTNFSSPTTAPQHHRRRGHAKEHGPLCRRPRQIRPGHQDRENGGYALTATRRCPHRTPNQRGRRPTQTEDVQSGHLADAAVWSGDLDDPQEAVAETQSLPPQLSSTAIEAEVAGPDSGHGCTGADGNPQHLRRLETAATALERSPRADRRRAATQSTEMSPLVPAAMEVKSVNTKTL
ncbi:hypothetical protein SprV_0200726600 [Sparganum proliferum]